MLKINDKVRHPALPEWGLGKVLAVIPDGKARVFFINAGEKILAMKHAPLELVEGPEAAHPILDSPNLAERAKGKRHRSLAEARLDFLHYFPEGFSDKEYFRHERDYKVEAHNLIEKLLGKEPFAALIEAQDYVEISRRALQVVNKTNLIFPNEKMALKDGMKKSPGNEALFATSLFTLLYDDGPLQVRFEKFADCLERLEAAKWTTATYFLFLAFPEEQMFLKPTVTQNAAELVKAELNYKPELNWRTYQKLLEFSGYLRDELAKMGMPARDMIDVQSFMWCITPGTYD
jgi:hypothetical protein